MKLAALKLFAILGLVGTSLPLLVFAGLSVANVKTSDGVTLRLSGVTFVYRDSHTAPGYIRGPSVTEDHGDMEHLPVSVPFGTIFAPFQVVRRVVATPSSEKSGEIGTVAITLSDGSSLKGTLGADFLPWGAWLTGQGAFGAVQVDLKRIVQLTFEAPAVPSKTFQPIGQKAGGPFTVTTGSEAFELTALWVPAKFNRRSNRFEPAKLEVGGVSFEPNFGNVASIRVIKGSSAVSIEVVTKSGERVMGDYRSTRDWLAYDYIGLLGDSKAGVVFVALDRSMQIAGR